MRYATESSPASTAADHGVLHLHQQFEPRQAMGGAARGPPRRGSRVPQRRDHGFAVARERGGADAWHDGEGITVEGVGRNGREGALSGPGPTRLMAARFDAW